MKFSVPLNLVIRRKEKLVITLLQKPVDQGSGSSRNSNGSDVGWIQYLGKEIEKYVLVIVIYYLMIFLDPDLLKLAHIVSG